MFVGGPHSPIGRGNGLKIRQVSVRVRLGAQSQIAGCLRVVSVLSQGQYFAGVDNTVHYFHLRQREPEGPAR